MGLEFDFSAVEDKLNQLQKKAGKEITDKALRKGAIPLLAKQLSIVPRDSNDLANSLIIGKISGSGGKKKILVGINPAKYDEVKYGFYQEHGTKVMLGEKWMKRSWLASSKKAQEEMAQSLAEDLGGI